MLNIAPMLYGQSDKYIKVWLYIFNHLAKGNNKLCVGDIISECSVTRQSFYDIVNRGLQVFNNHNIELTITRHHNKDRYININFNQLVSTNNQSSIKEKKDKSIVKDVNEQQSASINVIVTYLNEITNKHYRIDNATTIRLITARLNNGYNIEQFKYVIDIKTSQWLNTDHEKYLRPETLFGNKFESYLNETFTTNKPSDSTSQRIRNAEESIDRDWGI
jgi:uncharacterized phage protein (TIGR02220 family)